MPIAKAKPKVKVAATLEEDALFASKDEDWMACVHLGVFNTVANIAHEHRLEIDAEEKRERSANVEKAKRAVLKAYLVSKHKPGEHDQDDHGNWADPQHNQPRIRTTRHTDQGEVKEYVGEGDLSDLTYGIARLLRLPEKIAERSAHNTQHMTEWLKEKNWGQKLLMGAGFLGKSSPQTASAAAAVTVLQGLKDNPEARKAAKKYYLRYGGLEYATPGIKRGMIGRSQEQVHEKPEHFRNRVYKMLADDIPGDDAARLSKVTGSFPPSEGIIIGGKRVKRQDGTTLYGDAVVRALGKGGDNYLPFSAKHMAKARDGGWLLRRRTWGGPTAEDLHISMAFGAKGAGVVSRHGIYEIAWNDQYLTGKGRMGIEHKRILDRYNDLLGQIGKGEMKVDQFDQSGNRTGSKRVSLNHEGYSLALEALKAEFPWYIQSVKHEKASNTKKFNAAEGQGGFQIWTNKVMAKDDEVDVSAKVARKTDKGRDYVDAFEAATIAARPIWQPAGDINGGKGQARTPSQRDLDEQEAKRRGGKWTAFDIRQERERAAANNAGQGQAAGYSPTARMSQKLEEATPEEFASTFLKNIDQAELAVMSKEELELLASAALDAESGKVSFEATGLIKDVLDRSGDRYDRERDYDEPDASDLLRIEQEEEDERRRLWEQNERERKRREGQ